jgi:DNA-binding NarL/FixJ family response regulator
MNMRIIIVEDNPVFIATLRALFAREPDVSIEAAFRSAEEALEALSGCKADILMVDLGLPGMSGIEFIARAGKIMTEAEIMAITVFEDRDTILAAIRAGASSYILKSSMPQELVKAVYDLNRGEAPMSPRIARKIIRELRDNTAQELDLLSRRETEIIREIEAGMAYKEIASRLNISVHTVHSHIKNIYRKLYADGRETALINARKKGII